jgi:hypothetical protein
MTYSSILATRLKESQELEEKRRKKAAEEPKAQDASASSSLMPSLPTRPLRGRGRKRAAEDDMDEDEGHNKRPDPEHNAQPSTTLTQPPFITVPLREYQLQGVQWSS